MIGTGKTQPAANYFVLTNPAITGTRFFYLMGCTVYISTVHIEQTEKVQGKKIEIKQLIKSINECFKQRGNFYFCQTLCKYFQHSVVKLPYQMTALH
jgi:hypothetical protein